MLTVLAAILLGRNRFNTLEFPSADSLATCWKVYKKWKIFLPNPNHFWLISIALLYDLVGSVCKKMFRRRFPVASRNSTDNLFCLQIILWSLWILKDLYGKSKNKRKFVSCPTSEVMGRTGLTHHLIQITRADQPPRRLRHKPPDGNIVRNASCCFDSFCLHTLCISNLVSFFNS